MAEDEELLRLIEKEDPSILSVFRIFSPDLMIKVIKSKGKMLYFRDSNRAETFLVWDKRGDKYLTFLVKDEDYGPVYDVKEFSSLTNFLKWLFRRPLNKLKCLEYTTINPEVRSTLEPLTISRKEEISRHRELYRKYGYFEINTPWNILSFPPFSEMATGYIYISETTNTLHVIGKEQATELPVANTYREEDIPIILASQTFNLSIHEVCTH